MATKDLKYELMYFDIGINRNYNPVSDPDYNLFNSIRKSIDKEYYYPCQNDSNGNNFSYSRNHILKK